MTNATALQLINETANQLKQFTERTSDMYSKLILDVKSQFGNSKRITNFEVFIGIHKLIFNIQSSAIIETGETLEMSTVFKISVNPYSNEYTLETELYIEDEGVNLPKYKRKRPETIARHMIHVVNNWGILYKLREQYYEQLNQEREESANEYKQRVIEEYLAKQKAEKTKKKRAPKKINAPIAEDPSPETPDVENDDIPDF